MNPLIEFPLGAGGSIPVQVTTPESARSAVADTGDEDG
jgi:hypothetical protein